MLLDESLHFTLGCLAFSLKTFDLRLLRSEVASDDQRRRHQIHLVLFPSDDEVRRLADFLLLVINSNTRLHGLKPAVCANQIHVVLHRLGPIIHQALIYVVPIEQSQGGETFQHVFRKLEDGLLWLSAYLQPLQHRLVCGAPLVEHILGLARVRLELRMSEDAWLNLVRLNLGTAVARTVARFEQLRAQTGKHLPVRLKGIYVTLGNTP